MRRDDIPIPEPCTADWSAMTGDEGRRFCGQCSKHVHNLSAMTEPEAEAVLKKPEVCVRYSHRTDGQIRFQPTSRRALLGRGAMLAGALSVSLPAAAAMMVADETACEKPGLLSRLWTAVFGPSEETMVTGQLIAPIEPEEVVHVKMGDVKMEPVEPDPPPIMGGPMPAPKPEPVVLGRIAMPIEEPADE
ncbi:MAG: hypothetical protein ACI8S6_001613 [Myxococcota bacterium]|jgi:hypothetical protein